MDDAAARKLFAQPCEFMRAVAAPEQFPPGKLPEVAFIGRSNVGKSSLINALVGRKALARSSVTPGRTQQIVFFDLAHRLVLADLPGYGFAKAPKQTQEEWNILARHYLRLRTNLREICLLIDSRRGILKADLRMMDFLDENGAGYRAVLTKCDFLKGPAREERLAEVATALKKRAAAHPDVLMTSADKFLGMDELKLVLANAAI